MAKAVSKITNIGEKIGGSRKDLARARISIDQFNDMNSEEKIKLSKKDKIWPEPDWEMLVENGMLPMVAAKIKTIRRNLGVGPSRDYRGCPKDFDGAAALYVEMVNDLADRLLACKTEADLQTAACHFRTKYHTPGPGRTPPLPSRNGQPFSPDWFQIWKGNKSPLPFTRDLRLNFSYADLGRISKELDDGFPSKKNKNPAWKKNLIVQPVRVRLKGCDEFTTKIEAKYLTKTKVTRIGYFETEELAFKAAKEYYEEKKAKRLGLPERPHIDSIVRRGPDYRRGHNVSAEQLMDDFGFRGIEFGEWLPNDERQIVINAAWVAFHDLADAIGINPRGVGLNGTLALALGARGKGHAAAHFEPARMVMNITRMRGAGSLAHEWAHALDFFMANSRCPDAMKVEGNALRFATGGTLKFNNNRTRQLSFLPADVVQQVNSTLKAFAKIKLTADEDIKRWKENIAKEYAIKGNLTQKLIDSKMKMETDFPDGNAPSYIKDSADRYSASIDQQMKNCDLNIARMNDAIRDIQNGGDTRTVQTDFATESSKIGSTDYWVQPTEMFARAFEAWVQDRLKDAEGTRISQYLVHGTEAEVYDALVALGLIAANPYPKGRERKVIGEALEGFMAVVAPEYGLVREAPRPLNALNAELSLVEPESRKKEMDMAVPH